MAPRAHWKGFLKLSLVSCPIALYPAISAAEKISFGQVNRDTGNRLRQQMVDAVTGEVVDSHKKGRGYEVGENDFLIVPDEELAAAREEARVRPFSASPARSEDLRPPAQSARGQPQTPSVVERSVETQRDRERAPSIVPAPP